MYFVAESVGYFIKVRVRVTFMRKILGRRPSFPSIPSFLFLSLVPYPASKFLCCIHVFNSLSFCPSHWRTDDLWRPGRASVFAPCGIVTNLSWLHMPRYTALYEKTTPNIALWPLLLAPGAIVPCPSLRRCHLSFSFPAL